MQRTGSVNEMRRNQADKVTGRDDLRILPEGRKVLTITGDQKVGASRVGTLDEDVVIRIARHLDLARRNDQMAVVLEELKELQPQPSPNGQFRTGQHIRVFFENRCGNV